MLVHHVEARPCREFQISVHDPTPTREYWREAFGSKSGPLHVSRASAGYVLNFPSRPSESVPAPDGLTDTLGVAPEEAFLNAFNYMVVLKRAKDVRRLAPDLAAIARMDRPGLIVTAPGDGDYDCVSRYFAPAKGIPEDPVTGAAHCMLAPYWARRLGKLELRAYQASARGGEMMCRLVGRRRHSCTFEREEPMTAAIRRSFIAASLSAAESP
jgi:predicted PhzF superfamily epimerase YddE/YHI9